jgi:prepilin-type processing-associated H-X9-DG protein
VTCNIRLAVDACTHAADRLDQLQEIMPHDFMIEVGFVDGHVERTQGVYLYCRRTQLGEELRAELVKLLHPYPFTVLPMPELIDDGATAMHKKQVAFNLHPSSYPSGAEINM